MFGFSVALLHMFCLQLLSLPVKGKKKRKENHAKATTAHDVTCLRRPSLCQRCLWEKLSNGKWRTEEADEGRQKQVEGKKNPKTQLGRRRRTCVFAFSECVLTDCLPVLQ